MVLRGLKFGMLLQLAIGPICLMVFNTAATYGLLYALSLVAAIVLIDTLYIALSCAGVAVVLKRTRVKLAVRIAGAVVLVLFGANMVAGGLGYALFPQGALFSQPTGHSLFFQGLLLTASNPLTIVFWGGVLSAQVTENGWGKAGLFYFSMGCVLATVLFLTSVSLLASVFGRFLPSTAIQFFNVFVGGVLIIFGTRPLYKKQPGREYNAEKLP